MFNTKSKSEKLAEQLQDQSESLANTAATLAYQLRERVGPAVGQATGNAREWARPRYEHGLEVAAPKLESAVSGLAPKVDTARDKIVDELIPRIAETISAWAAAGAATKDEAVKRGHGAAAVISGDAVASRGGKKKMMLMVLGLLGAVGAAVMTFMKKSAPKDDPWTTPLADPYVSAPNGRHSAPSPVDDLAGTTRIESEILDPLDEVGMPLATGPLADKDLTAPGGKDKADTNNSHSHKSGADKDDSGNSPRG